MMQREGLNFSDYFDDSVPYEVKPVPCVTPMQETEDDFVGNSDIPTQSKDLFKGLWEDIIKENSEYWLDPEGHFHRAKMGHQEWAENYLSSKGIRYSYRDAYRETPDDDGNVGVYKTMYMLKYVRIYAENGTLYATNTVNEPTNAQMRSLKDSAIESDLRLHVKGKRIELFESKYVDKGGRSLFIESMMPDNMDVFKSHLVQLFAYLQKELQLKSVPSVKLISDEKNADKVLGKTAYYNPDEKLVVLYITNRHQKDILRSFAHEIIHHWQHENEKLHEGDDKKGGTGDPQYAQNNPWLRQMEKQAYLLGNMLFRDWEDQKKAEDKKSGNDGKGGRANKKVKETTYSLGDEYPPKKMDYKG